MKRMISLLCLVIGLLPMLAGCGNQTGDATNTDASLQIVCTIFPEYDWVGSVLGENPAHANVTLLLDNGVDMHSFQPSAKDILTISDCDLFVYVGGESDAWVEDALQEAKNKDMRVLNLIDILGENTKEEALAPSMEAEEASGDADIDEHVWLSIKNASLFVEAISEALCTMDDANKTTYQSNAADYIKSLNDLDQKYQTAANTSSLKTLLFGDRFPFRYLVDDYALSYYAAFPGCSAETEASFETITFLAQKVDELSLPCVLVIEGSDQKVAETIVKSTAEKELPIRVLDSMQATTFDDANNGTTYLSIMEENLSVIQEALLSDRP